MAVISNAPALPTYDKMLWPTLLALKELGGSGSNAEVADKAIELAGYSEEQQAALHGSGPGTEIRYRMAWARTYLGIVGAIENSSRGVWSITDYGRSLTESDMAAIPPKVRAVYRRGEPVGAPENQTATTSGTAETEQPDSGAFNGTAITDWRERLLSVLQSVPPASFERLCQRLLESLALRRSKSRGAPATGALMALGSSESPCSAFRSYSSASDTRETSVLRRFAILGALWLAVPTRDC